MLNKFQLCAKFCDSNFKPHYIYIYIINSYISTISSLCIYYIPIKISNVCTCIYVQGKRQALYPRIVCYIILYTAFFVLFYAFYLLAIILNLIIIIITIITHTYYVAAKGRFFCFAYAKRNFNVRFKSARNASQQPILLLYV